MPAAAAIAQLGHRYTMYVDPRIGAPSRFHDPNGRVVATAILESEWNGVVSLGSFDYRFAVSDDDSVIRDRFGGRAFGTSRDGVVLLAGDERSRGRYELVTTGPDRFGVYRRDRNLAVLNHAKIGSRVDMIGETSTPGFVGLLATLIVAFVPPRNTSSTRR
jgi:hypothetical protein